MAMIGAMNEVALAKKAYAAPQLLTSQPASDGPIKREP